MSTCIHMLNQGTLHTFSRHLKKKLTGSIPYSIVDPMIGNQWNTTGGDDELLKTLSSD